MSKWRKWSAFSRTEKRMLLKASFYLVAIYVALRLLPFGRFRRFFTWWTSTPSKEEASESLVKTTCWAIQSAAYHLPLNLLCLPQALTAKAMLYKDPYLKVPIGVLLQENGHFEAHAWVERKEVIIVGELPDKHFQPIWEWQ